MFKLGTLFTQKMCVEELETVKADLRELGINKIEIVRGQYGYILNVAFYARVFEQDFGLVYEFDIKLSELSISEVSRLATIAKNLWATQFIKILTDFIKSKDNV